MFVGGESDFELCLKPATKKRCILNNHGKVKTLPANQLINSLKIKKSS